MRTLIALTVAVAASTQTAAAQLRFAVLGEYDGVEHKVDIGRGVERSTGPLFGGTLVLRVGSLLEISGGGATGSLEPDSAVTAPTDLARVGGLVSFVPVPWLALRLGATSQTFTTTFSSQRWVTARVGAETRLAFVGGGITSVLRFDFFPLVDVTDLEKPDRAFAAAAGIRWAPGIVVGELLYSLERYDFPAAGGVERHEQVAMLIARLGLQFGHSRASSDRRD